MAKCHPRQEHLAVLRAGQPGADTAGNEHTGQFAGRVDRAVVARLGDPGGPVASYLAEPSIVAGQRHSYAVEVINSLCDCEVVVGLMRALRGYASLGCAESSV